MKQQYGREQLPAQCQRPILDKLLECIVPPMGRETTSLVFSFCVYVEAAWKITPRLKSSILTSGISIAFYISIAFSRRQQEHKPEKGQRMGTIAGIFNSPKQAERAFSELQTEAGFRAENVVLLAPGSSTKELDAVPTDEGEQPGMGSAIGGVVGGAVGLAAGSVVANLVLPGVGTILAIGLGAGAFGIGGAVAGAASGSALENQLSPGLPKDELFFYEDALKQCRSVLIGTSKDDEVVEKGRAVIERNGAESIDAARDNWWIGLRDAEEEQYDLPGGDFRTNEVRYRTGFETALHPDCRGKSFEAAAPKLRELHADVCEDESFRRGYERGRAYYAERQTTTPRT